MKKFGNYFKGLFVYSMIFSLMQTTFIFTAYAQENSTARELLGVANVALGTYAQVQNQNINSKQMIAQAQKNAALMQTLSPSCRKADGTSCHTIAGKYFPECPLPATIAAMPRNVCSETLPDVQQSAMQISSMYNYQQISESWVDYYTQMQNTASNATVPFGLKCLEDKKKALDSQLIEMVNNLTRLQEQLNKEKENFKAFNKTLLEDLASTNDELMGIGTTTKNNLKNKTTNFANYFSASCQSVIGEEGIAQGSSIGLLGIMQSIAPANKRAADYNQNRNSIENEVRADIQKFQNAINTGGLQNYFDGKIADTSSYKSLGVATQKQAMEFKIAKDRIATELAKLNYEIPVMDKNFEVDFPEFVAQAKKTFSQQYINDCMTGADRSGLAISAGDILNSLKQESTGNRGDSRNGYRDALEKILQGDEFMDKKLEKMKALEGTYKDISVTYRNSNGQIIRETPYDLYMKTMQKCEQRFAQDDQSTASGSRGVSQKKKVERGEALLRELQSLHANYASNLGTKVLEQVLSCNGVSKKAGASCSDKEAFNHTGASFCMAHANECANEVNGCYAEANKQVETKKAKMTTLAANYNKNVTAMVARSNQIYTAQKNAVMELIKVVQARFPGTNFPIPANMFVSMPEMKKDTFGIDLANDGNLAFMDEFPKKIDLLKTMFKDQQTKVDDELDDYINKQAMAMDTQKSRWQELGEQCKSMADNIKKDVAKYNAEGMKKQGELDAKVANYCQKYSRMKENPLAACDDVQKLAESADAIAARLTNEALKYTGKFRNVCNKFNNEASSVPESCDDPDEYKKKSPAAKRKCDAANDALARAIASSNGSSKSKTRLNFDTFCAKNNGLNDDKEFIKAASEHLSEEDQEILKDVTSLESLKSKKNNLGDSGYNFFTSMMALKDDNNKDNLCKQLQTINKSSATKDKSEDIEKAKTTLENEAKSKLIDLKKKEATALKEKKELEDDLKTAKEDAKADIAKKLKRKSEEADDLAADIKKVPENLKTELAQKDSSMNKNLLNDAIAMLVPNNPTMEQAKELALQRIGEQAVDSACDAQASNINQGKNLGSAFLDSINNLDKSILGSSK